MKVTVPQSRNPTQARMERALIEMDTHRRLNIQLTEIPELIRHLRAVYTVFVEDTCQEVMK